MTEHTTVEAFFIRYGKALASGDLPGISGCYEEPAFVLSDQGGRPLTRAEIEANFDGAAEQHRAEGLVGAVPTVVALEDLSATLVSVDVHWDYVDAEGQPAVEDGYRYVLRAEDGAEPQICNVIVTPERLRR
jgi:hypothetical protein